MEKMTWTRPVAAVEQFMPNEYIAACWGVACNTTAANKIEDDLHNDPYGGHRASECGRFDQQAVTGYIANGEFHATGMVEIGTYWGDLDCTLYTDSTFTQVGNWNDVQNGETIYWKTEGLGGNVYHHVGVVQATNANKLKHS